MYFSRKNGKHVFQRRDGHIQMVMNPKQTKIQLHDDEHTKNRGSDENLSKGDKEETTGKEKQSYDTAVREREAKGSTQSIISAPAMTASTGTKQGRDRREQEADQGNQHSTQAHVPRAATWRPISPARSARQRGIKQHPDLWRRERPVANVVPMAKVILNPSLPMLDVDRNRLEYPMF